MPDRVPLTARELARRLGVELRAAQYAIAEARRTGAHPVTRGESNGGRPPWVIWWPTANDETREAA